MPIIIAVVPTLTLAGVTIDDLTGQAYRDTSNVFEIASGSNYESTSEPIISTQYKSYANIDGTVTMLSAVIPIANTGVSSAYAISDPTINITFQAVNVL